MPESLWCCKVLSRTAVAVHLLGTEKLGGGAVSWAKRMARVVEELPLRWRHSDLACRIGLRWEGSTPVSIDIQLRKAAARCLSAMQRYRDGERTAAAREKMAAEIDLIIGWLMEMDLPSGMAEAGVLKPVEEQLLDQYGHEAGRRLNGEFVSAFEKNGMPIISQKTRANKQIAV